MTSGYEKLPNIEVGAVLAVRNLHEMREELAQLVRAGFQKRDIMVIVMPDHRGRVFSVEQFALKYLDTNENLVGDICERWEWLIANEMNEMIYVQVHDHESRRYEVGFLHRPKRRTHSLPNRRVRRALGARGRPN